MSLRSNGSYIGYNRVTTTSQGSASGIWSLAAAERRRRAAAWPMPFLPSNVTGLQLWLDASDASTLYDATSGGSLVAADGAVARWEDKSGNARHFTQATSGSRPTRKTSQQNGKDTLLFDGSNDFLDGSDFLDADTGGLTAFVVYKRNATGAIHELVDKSDTSGNGWFLRHSDENMMNAYLASGNQASTVSTASAVSATDYIVGAFKFTAGSFQSVAMYRNGATLAMGSPATPPGATGIQTPPSTTGIVRLGAQEYQGTYYFHANANIAEVILYNSALSDTDREAVENYLLAKWGI